MYQKASQYASNAIDAVVNFFTTLPGKVWTWLTNTISKIAAWGSSMVSNAKTAASNTISSVVNFFATLPGKVWTWLGNTVNKVASWGANLRSKGAEAAGNLVGAVVSGVGSLPSRMLEVGKNIVHGVWNGICNAAGWFKSQVRSFFSGIVDGVKMPLVFILHHVCLLMKSENGFRPELVKEYRIRCRNWKSRPNRKCRSLQKNADSSKCRDRKDYT